jgi:hypothetical protein
MNKHEEAQLGAMTFVTLSGINSQASGGLEVRD